MFPSFSGRKDFSFFRLLHKQARERDRQRFEEDIKLKSLLLAQHTKSRERLLSGRGMVSRSSKKDLAAFFENEIRPGRPRFPREHKKGETLHARRDAGSVN